MPTMVNERSTELSSDRNAPFMAIDPWILSMHAQFDSLEAKLDRHFLWLMGTMVAGFTAVMGALIGIVYR